jgi:nucleotide-binding universal stress UspA family protein
MKSLAKILLPVDFSERSAGAAQYAKMLACHFHSELTLLHVMTPMQYAFGAMELSGPVLNEAYVSCAEQVRQELESSLACELKDVDTKRVVLEGDAAREIVHYAHEQNIDLIVMPTHGYGPFRRLLLGSVTAKVLHDADCPVWTGAHLEEAPREESISLRNIVCAIDLGPQSCKTLEWAAGMQKEFGGRLTVVHAMTCSQNTGHDEVRRRHEIESAAREDLGRLAQRLGTQAELRIEAGDPPQVVCDMAWGLNAGLLVIGRGSAAGVFGRLRTNAYAIIRQAPCPVMSA